MQERGHTPAPLGGHLGGSDGNGGGGDLTDEVRGVEERGQDGTLLGVTELTNHGGTGDDGEQNTETEDETGDDIHGNVLGETLDQGTDDHDDGADHDGPATTELLGDPGGEGDTEDGTQHVGGIDETEQTSLDGEVTIRVDTAIAEVLVPLLRDLEGVDELRVETGGHLNTHAAAEKPHVHHAQVRLLVPWRLVLGDKAGHDGVGSVTEVDVRLADHVGGCGRRVAGLIDLLPFLKPVLRGC